MALSIEIFLVLTAGVTVLFLLRRRKSGAFPPGPKGVPVLGNVDLPTTQQWLTYTEWKKTYGDLIGLQVLGQPIVLINKYEIVDELFNKRGSMYSDRPGFSLIQEWGGWDWMLTPMRYNQECITQRKFLNRFLNSTAIKAADNLLEEEAVNFVRRILAEPKRFREHTRLLAGANIMMLAYGHKVRDEHDKLIELAENANASLEVLTNVGAHPIDLFPWLLKLPRRVWGSKFVGQMEHMRTLAHRLITEPYLAVKKELEDGVAYPSMASRLIESNTSADGVTENEKVIKGTTAGAYVAGADTTVSTLYTIMLALMISPHVQKKAHEQLDAVLRGQRLPTLADRPFLPYIDAILLESMRWGPVAPLAVPHRLTQDDHYEGYFFKANTTFIANSWGILHDEDMFPDPMTFNPDRFLDAEGKIRTDILDPRDIGFGYGRRVCPGRFLGENSVWIALATLLSVFQLKKALGADGKPIEPELVWESALISHPRPYQCDFALREGFQKELLPDF
ncbi:hypothetical protein AX16_009091 [Volvariella volvacea WC 439]|nr:hypothetical protein AX16_009091 [Volvariella volvacea WC 439]